MPSRDFVLARANGCGIFNFYPTLEAAAADARRANGGPFLDSTAGPYLPMTYAAFEAAKRALYLTPEQEITEERYMEMLEVLPPMAYHGGPGFESFLMCEYTSVPYTEQYARRGDKYFVKMVDATDKSTWMKAEVTTCLRP
jgi:hypothetical protein